MVTNPNILARIDKLQIAQMESATLNNRGRRTAILPDKRTIVIRPGIFGEYTSIVALYSQRNLTKQTDALNAVNGLLAMIALGLDTEMIYGLPESMLDAALLWKAQTCLARRCRDTIPSWSWAGWQGQIAYDSTVEFKPEGRKLLPSSEHHLERLRPFVTWFKASKDGAAAELVNRTGMGISDNVVNRPRVDEYKQGSLPPLSSGKHNIPSQPNTAHSSISPRDIWPQDWRQAESMPNFDSNRMNDSHIKSWNPMHLQFWTLCASKFLSRVARKSELTAAPVRDITNEAGAVVGKLVLDEENGQKQLKGSTKQHIPALIVISEAQYFSDEKLNETYSVYDFEDNYLLYNVLLVDLDPCTGVASRKGVGKVTKYAWQSYGPEWKFIRLK
jgi:hypothetical protein